MKIPPDPRAETVWIKVPLDAETAARLQLVSDECHGDPVVVAASLLHDVLADDEQAHLTPEGMVSPGNSTHH